MKYEIYIKTMIGRVFKLLPMREQSSNDGADVFLDIYISDLAHEAVGAYGTFPELYSEKEYISFTNTIQYLSSHWGDVDFKSYRSAILKMTNNLAHLLEGVSSRE